MHSAGTFTSASRPVIQMSDENAWKNFRQQFEDVVGNGNTQHGLRLNIEAFYCPICAAHISLRSAPLKDRSGLVYRAGCADRSHYQSKWHRSEQGLLMELIHTFETGDSNE